ncbi:hypothetical protein ACFWNK_27460 [Streptomyces sp. NPDC058417]|uniref:hypothetical protein n=1 Tax=unclassified Streptomyces TaxID=2593676 RepID=UPI00364E21FC
MQNPPSVAASTTGRNGTPPTTDPARSKAPALATSAAAPGDKEATAADATAPLPASTHVAVVGAGPTGGSSSPCNSPPPGWTS